MKLYPRVILAIVVAWLPMFCTGQDSNPQNPPTQNASVPESNPDRATPAPAMTGLLGVDTETTEEDNSAPPQIPAVLGGRALSLSFTPELERSNFLRGGLNFGVGYDDNALLVPTGEIGNITYSIFPSIAIDQRRPRMSWNLDYGAGVTINQRLSDRNQGAHNLDFESLFRLSPHVNLRVAQNVSITTGIFGAGDTTSVPSSTSGQNTSIISPLANERWFSTVAELDYHFALNDVVGGTGTFYDLHYRDVPQGAGSLVDSRTASAGAFWLHRVLRRDWAGMTYRFQRLTYDPNGETLVHSVTFVNTLGIRNRFSFTGFIGPEYNDNRPGSATSGTQPARFTDWSVSGGVEGGWTSVRTSFTAGYGRRINDGGGLMGAVHEQNVHVNFRREFHPGWSANLGANYGNNDSIAGPVTGNPASINTTTLGASIERNVGKSFGLQAGYFHDFQSQSGSTTANQNYDAHRNRFLVTLSYQWAKALGR